MIDYENVLKNFIGEVIVYLTRSLKNVKDEIVFECIVAEIEKLKVIKSNPIYYADYNVRVKNNLLIRSDAFIVPDGTYRWLHRVIFAAKDLKSKSDYEREKAQNVLMGGYKNIKIINAKNVFQKIKLNLLSAEQIIKINQK